MVGVAAVAVVALISLMVGAYVYVRYVKTSEDYLVAGRLLGAGLIGGSLIAAYCNSYTIFVNSALANGFPFGNYLVLLLIGLSAPVVLGAAVGVGIRNRFRRGFTQPEFFAARFGTGMHAYGTVTQIANHLILLLAQIMIGGLVMEQLFHVPAWVFMLMITLAMILYTTVGGLWASVATDYLQILAALIAMLVILPVAIFYFGGTGAIYDGIVQHRSDYLTFQGGWDFWKTVIGVILIIFSGVVVPQYIWQRYYAARDNAAIWKGLIALALIYPGMAAVGAIPTYIVISQGVHLSAPDQAPIAFLSITPAWMFTPFAMVMLLFIISTADSLLMALVSLFSVDVYAKYIKRKPVGDKELMVVSRAALIGFALAGLALAFFRVTILQLWFIWGIMVITLIGPIFLGLYSKRVKGWQVTVGAVTGLALSCYLYFLSPWKNDDFLANMVSLLVPIVVAYGLALFSSQSFTWDQLDKAAQPVAAPSE